MCKSEKLMIVSMGVVLMGWLAPAAVAQVPVTDGLVFWLDASKPGDLTLAGNNVSRWNDRSGAGAYAEQTDPALQPTYVRGALNGKGIVDFGDSIYNSTDAPWMQFRDASDAALNISNVRTVFWVCGMDAGTDGFLLGDDNNYHFHRGQQNQIWDGASGWASANIRDGSTYLNGVLVDGTATVLPTDYSIISLVTTGNVETSMLTRDRTYRAGGIKLGELLIYDRALTDEERQGVEAYLYTKWMVPGAAQDPQPSDGATDVLRDVILSWTPGDFAATHDVYFGTVFADVNDADTTNTLGVLVGPGQAANTYDVGRLELGQTYYWRVDEVNAPPDSTVFKGGVWSFTVEPYARPIPGANITATASSSALDTAPEKTIDGSGLNADDQHSIEDTDMWLSAPFAPQPTWIQYAFDKSYRLDTMIVWNSNQKMEPYVGFGARNVTVEYSTDANDWTVLGEFEFVRAPGADTCTADTTVDFGGVGAQYVRLTITSNWGGFLQQYGLSEVRFLYVPLSASEPDPADGATGVAPQTTLSWRPGRQVASHQVFLGTDPNELSLLDTVDEPRCPADLNLEETYYWKVVEVNEAEDPASWESDVWSFSTSPALMVDDFENYTDDMEAEETIWQTWFDGITDPAYGGSTVGNPEAPFAEQDIVYNGAQSMNFYYENVGGVTHAEAERLFDTPQNWTKHGIQTLSLAFHGDPNNAGQMYLKINNTDVPYNGEAGDIKRTLWQPWNVDLASTGADLANVTSIAVGADGASPLGALYFDDIALYPRAGEFITPVDPGTTGLAAWYRFDGTFNDSAGTNHATAIGDAAIVNDPARGQVVSLDGIGDAVDVPPLAATTNTLTIAMWVNSTVDTSELDYASTFHGDGWEAGDLHWRYQYARVSGGINGVAGGGNLVGRSRVVPNQWNHVAVTVSETEFALWLDGHKEVSLALEEPASVILGDGLIGAWLGTDGSTMSRWFTGFIDDARFYNRTLSQEEIAWLAGRTVPFAKPF